MSFVQLSIEINKYQVADFSRMWSLIPRMVFCIGLLVFLFCLFHVLIMFQLAEFIDVRNGVFVYY